MISLTAYLCLNSVSYHLSLTHTHLSYFRILPFFPLVFILRHHIYNIQSHIPIKLFLPLPFSQIILPLSFAIFKISSSISLPFRPSCLVTIHSSSVIPASRGSDNRCCHPFLFLLDVWWKNTIFFKHSC